MFHKASSPRVFLLRAAVVTMVFTALFAGSLPIGNTRVSAALPLAAPTNDNFSNAQPILGASGVIMGTTVGATKESGEPTIDGVAGTASVWYKWQAPFNGRFVFSVSDPNFSNINSLLAVYTGNTMFGTQLAKNDDDPILCGRPSFSGFEPPILSRIAFDAIGGVFYHIAVDTKNTPGNFRLRWGRSATITVLPRSVSNGGTFGAALAAKVDGDICLGGTPQNLFTFSNVPTGGAYTVSIIPFDPIGQFNFVPSSQNGSTQPLTGDIALTFYLMSPTKSISGRVTNLPGNNITGLTVMCVSINGGRISQSGTITTIGSDARFVCPSLPVNAEYQVTPAKLGLSFAPVDRTLPPLFGDTEIVTPFVATAESPHTISGRVTQPNGVTGLSGVTVALGGAQTASAVTNSNGDYSFTVPYGGNYTVTPSHSNFTFTPSSRSFSNLTGDQTGDFTAVFILQLILDNDGQAAALDSIFHTRDPFPVINNANVLNQGVDRNTRVAIFVSNLQLGPGEPASSVVINLVGSDNQTYDIPAEDVRSTSNPAFTQVIFRLPNTLSPGTCTLFVKAHGLTSNIAAIKIGG